MTLRTLQLVWNFAQGIVPELPPNPVQIERWYDVPERERHIRSDDLPAFYQTVTALPNRTMADYILLMLFTGLRRREAASLRWADVDFSLRLIRLPAKRTKAGRRLDLPMGDYVHALLVARRALGFENEYVFPGTGRTGHVREPKSAYRAIEEACGIHVSSHDLRRTFITVGSMCPIPAMALPALVNHSPGGGITADYNRLRGSDLAEAMQTITNRLKDLCQVPVAKGVVALSR